MDAQRREDITGWDAREFSGGFDGLREHVDDGFSGAITDGSGWLFVLDGRVIGVVDAELDAFENASGTVYEAPHEALPVLFAMQEDGGEKRAQYYTNDTPLAAADRKLSEGGFTGYVELAENVLSGDYYVAYTAGESMAAAYVGNSRRLETGEAAFDLADDEVGIYTVYEVDLEVRELPQGTGSSGPDRSNEPNPSPGADEPNPSPGANEPRGRNESAGSGVASEAGPSNGGTPSQHTGIDDAESGERIEDTVGGEEDRPTTEGSRSVSRSAPAESHGESDPRTEETTDTDGSTTASEPNSGRGNDSESTATTSSTDVDETATERVDMDASTAGRPPESNTPTSTGSGSDGTAPDGTTPDDEGVFSEEAQWREAKTIPALDPSETDVRDEAAETNRDGAERSRSGGSGSHDPGTTDESPDPRPTPSSQGNAAVSRPEQRSDATHDRIERLETELEETRAERESIATERDALREERDSLTRDRDELEAERDRLESEVEELRAEIERLRTKLADAEAKLPESDRSLSVAEARDGTNLFIRYESKSDATLEDAHDGRVGRDDLRENLRIEHHTSFETESLTVDGQPFEEFLRETMEYGFTRWLVEELPFEIGETGNGSALRDLYDALPEIDRAEIGGSVSIVTQEGGEEEREQRDFDLVLRDRMGNPLFVAELNDTRAPTKGATLESLVANGGRIAESNENFAGAFAVTASFFEPDALEVAGDAVGGGLFGRSKRKSFVKLSRKRGYHLCLAESREGGFHLTVPDL